MSRAPYVPSARERERRAEIETHGYRNAGRPEPGFFAIRLVKGGVEVPARIIYAPTPDPWFPGNPQDRSPLWAGEINGEADPDASPQPTERVWRVWHSGRRIDEAEYRYLRADRDWAREHSPALPEANPRRSVDLKTLPLPF